MYQIINLGSNELDRVRSLRKILTRLRGKNFCTSSARFASSFIRQPNGPGCTQIVQNAPKHQFWVKWGASAAFVAKNSDATSWHELLRLGTCDAGQDRLGTAPADLPDSPPSGEARFPPRLVRQPNGPECTQIV